MKQCTLCNYHNKPIDLDSLCNYNSSLYEPCELLNYAELILQMALQDDSLSDAILANNYRAIHSIMRTEYTLELTQNRIEDFNICVDSIRVCHIEDLEEY